jgi:haloacetate dehalogenase
MPDLTDLYPGYASRWIDTSFGTILVRVADVGGPPLLLLHGHPESTIMWHRVAPVLVEHFTLVIADLPGCGWSAVPRAQADHAPYTKRAMASASFS